ncbi:MAG: molybdenum cofactor guanylyltransferase [Desulfotignum sp.]|nr:molybdenum cofactor guanylyltransferase [Desulfotignum sp.]
MKLDCTGVILAGGKNSRLPGKKKTFHRVGEVSILERLCMLSSKLFKETIIVVNEPEEFMGLDMMVVTDIIPARCVLAGLHAGLFYASYPYAYVTACDIPFASEAVIRHLVDRVRPGDHVVIPRTNDGLEPLSALYSRDCLPLIEESLKNSVFKIKKFYKKKHVREVPVSVLKKLDPDMGFIFNVNTPADLEKARQMALK